MGAWQIIGREDELAMLRATIDAEPDAPNTIVLHGDPGIGKTTLLNAAVDYARERGLRVIGGTGHEAESTLAFAGLHQLLFPISPHLDTADAHTRGVLRRVLGMQAGPPPDRLSVCSSTLAVLVALARDSSVLIAVEDMHWVDEPTQEVLTFVLHRMRGHDIRAVLARRTAAATERAMSGVTMLRVPPLSPVAAEVLLHVVRPDLPDPLIDRVLAEAAGNPLALLELPTVLGTDAEADLELVPQFSPLRTRLEMAYGARLAALEDGLRERLVVSALDSRGPDPPSARRSVAYTPDDLMVLEAQGLVTADSTGSRLMFRHPLVRSAVVASVPSQVVRSSHSVLARVHWDDPQRRAWHLGAAALEADDTIAREIADAAEEMAARGGSSNAVSAFERAADLAETGAAVGSHLIRAAATAAEAGQFDKAVALNERARTLVADHDHAARRDLTTALLLMRGDGDLFGARRLLQTAWANTGNSSEELRQQILWMLIAVAYHRFDPDLWADVDRMVRAAGPTSEMVTLTHAFLRDPDRSQADLQHEMRHRAGAVDGSTPPASTVELAHLLRRADLLAEQRAMLEELIRRERGSGALYQVASAHELLGDALLATGEWERAEDLLNAGVALSTRHGLGLCANMCRARLAMLAASRGDRESADQYAQLIERWGRPRGVGLLTVESLRTRALAALADSDHAAAMALYIQLLDFELPVSCSALTPWYVFDLTHCAIRTGQPGIGRTAAGQVRGLGAQVLTPRSAMLLDAADALLAPDDHADAAFRRALAPLMTDRWPFDKARVRLAFGERLRRTAGPTAARVELRRAADAFAQLGATAWQAQAEQELRATGVTVPASSSPRDGAGRSGELTPQQREVVDLAATGLSNKDIAAKLYLSPRTVSAHLYRAFPKLGVTSRSALRDALTDP